MYSYNIEKPFISKIKKRALLNKEGSTKKTYHIILDIEDSNIAYLPGDSVAIIPQNEKVLVDDIIKYIKPSKNIEILDPKTKQNFSLFDFLLKKANITKPSPKLLKLFIENPTIEQSKKYLHSYHVIDILKEFSNHQYSAQELCDCLLPLLPRLYSAASSLKMYPNEIHLLVTHVAYELQGIKRKGVCTEFLCHTSKLLDTPISMYIEPSHGFNLTKDLKRPLIMIAAGCGLAPFRSFLEDRYLDDAPGENWLFFGERNQKLDFYFEEFLQDLSDKNFLRLTTAFSRDQEDKIYVQDKLLENQSDIWQWIQNGALLYICGDVKMSRGVDETLKLIFIEEGNLNPKEANDYLKNLIKEKHYLKDVY